MAATGPALERLRRGDGHPVIVLPGFTASDASTAPLRSLLDRLGYQSHGWHLGPNIGPTREIMKGVAALLKSVSATSGRSVSLVGWSLGGIYARELARATPEAVRQVITLGSPIQMLESDPSAASKLWESRRHLYEIDTLNRFVREADRPALPVPTTAVYTRTDGIVQWKTCLVRSSATSENIEVRGSHCGLGFNPAAVYAITDRLAQAPQQWKHFTSPLWLKGLFPSPAKLEHIGLTSAA